MLKLETFEPKFTESWWRRIRPFFESDDAYTLYQYLKIRSKLGAKILPSSDKTFESFKLCDFNALKCVVLGMEPYSSVIGGVEVATGLAFDCSVTKKLQPSLEYLWYSIRNSLELDETLDMTPNIDWLAKQGILFLNYSMTVEKNKIGSHLSILPDKKNLWEPFYKFLFGDVFYGTSGIVYILMGNEAKKAKRYINPLGNYILETNHPSYAARTQDTLWKADDVWKQLNYILKSNVGEYYKIDFDYTHYTEELNILPF